MSMNSVGLAVFIILLTAFMASNGPSGCSCYQELCTKRTSRELLNINATGPYWESLYTVKTEMSFHSFNEVYIALVSY